MFSSRFNLSLPFPSPQRAPHLFLLRRAEIGDGVFEHLGGKRNCLQQCRVRMHGQADVLGIRPHLDRQRRIGDQVAGIWADDAAASRRLVASSNSSWVTPSSTERQGSPARRPREQRPCRT